MSKPSSNPRGGASRLADGYRHALVAADVFFGGFVISMVVIAGVGFYRGDAPLLDLIAVGAFLVVNVALSEVSRRIDRPYHVEGVRLVVGGLVTAAAYFMVTGPLAPWWPGFMVLSLGGAIGFGLLTGRSFWGRFAVAVYLGLFAGTTLLRDSAVDGYAFALQVGIIATVGLMFAEIMGLLGRTLQAEHEQSLQLQAARDALFAEMEVAQKIQTLLLPEAPHIDDSDVVGRMVTATEVGGDYYDVLESADRTLVAIGDVSGHGVASGLTMMMARTALLGAIESAPAASLSNLYSVLNRCVCESLERMGQSMYMTLALLEHHGAGRYTSVGMHLPPLVYRRGTRTVEEVTLRGTWLGVLPHLSPEHIPQTEIQLQPGDLMVLYTDGIIERFSGDEMFGFSRLEALIAMNADRGSAAIVESVLESLREFGGEQDDDVTLLVITYDGVAGQRVAA